MGKHERVVARSHSMALGTCELTYFLFGKSAPGRLRKSTEAERGRRRGRMGKSLLTKLGPNEKEAKCISYPTPNFQSSLTPGFQGPLKALYETVALENPEVTWKSSHSKAQPPFVFNPIFWECFSLSNSMQIILCRAFVIPSTLLCRGSSLLLQ